MVQFERPVGAQADVKELEYISALHQTGASQLRSDGSITDKDIKAYLRSRFGIEVTLNEVRWIILQGFGGSDKENEVIDLMELTAIILVPLLLKAAALLQHKQQGHDNTTKAILPPNIVSPPEQLLETSLQIILHDVTGKYSQDRTQELSPEFLREMLSIYGEMEMASDDNLIQEMINHARPSSVTTTTSTTSPDLGNNPVLFNVSSFAEALTKDVKLYDIANEAKISTSIQDVFQEDSGGNHDKLHHIYTAPEIDIQAGTYRSKALAVSLWGCVLFGLFASAIELQSGNVTSSCEDIQRGQEHIVNLQAFLCQLRASISGWVSTFLYFSAAGIISIGLGSLGNYFGHSQKHLPVIGAIYILAFGFLSTGDYREIVNSRSYYEYMAVMSKLLACLTAYFHFCNYMTIAHPNLEFFQSTWGYRLGFAPLTREMHVKAAGAHKANQLVSNAMIIMMGNSSSVFRTYFGHGLSAFTLNGLSKVREGGFFWLWKRIHDSSIFEKEGIWYSTRLVASNCTQLAISFFILLLGIDIIQRVQQNFGAEQFKLQAHWLLGDIIDSGIDSTNSKSVSNNLTNVFGSSLATIIGQSSSIAAECQNLVTSAALIDSLCPKDAFGNYECSDVNSEQALCILIENPDLAELHPNTVNQLMEGTGFNSTSMQSAVESQIEFFIEKAVQSLYPEKMYMVTVPLRIGMIVAVLAALRLAVMYLPGVTTTILELRSGVIPSLHSPTFQKYRVAPDTVTMLTGSLFWGCLMSSILFGSVIGFLVFLFLWQGSVFSMLRLCALLIGIVTIILIKVIVVHFCFRKRYYQGLYRTRPSASNILLLALEWANFVFTSAFILVRMLKILLISIASIGQIDRRLLAEGVGQIGPLEFDPYPTIHIRDLVAHEAHRHPYIEILGTMYLMKLRYSDKFGSRAGSAWRLMFIYALMPWMHRYRILDKTTEPEMNSEQGAPAANPDEENRMTTTLPKQLPSLRNSSRSSLRLIVEENRKLKEQITKLLRKEKEGL